MVTVMKEKDGLEAKLKLMDDHKFKDNQDIKLKNISIQEKQKNKEDLQKQLKLLNEQLESQTQQLEKLKKQETEISTNIDNTN